jgi:hypothetical protein
MNLSRQAVISFCGNKLAAFGVDWAMFHNDNQSEINHIVFQTLGDFMGFVRRAVVSAPFKLIGGFLKEGVAVMSDYRVGMFLQHLDNPLHSASEFRFVHVSILANRRLFNNTGFPLLANRKQYRLEIR